LVAAAPKNIAGSAIKKMAFPKILFTVNFLGLVIFSVSTFCPVVKRYLGYFHGIEKPDIAARLFRFMERVNGIPAGSLLFLPCDGGSAAASHQSPFAGGEPSYY